MKKAILILWVVIAIAVLISGIVSMIFMPTIITYLSFGGVSAVVCIVHFVIDYFSATRDGCLLYIALCILFGPIYLVIFICYTIGIIKEL